MADRPIIFSGPMVRALLDGRKNQTRRVLKPQPPEWARFWQQDGDGWGWTDRDEDTDDLCHWPDYYKPMAPPYSVGDRLWVREAWAPNPDFAFAPPCALCYRADPGHEHDDLKWKPSIHMPRWASRLTLTVTYVRVQRMQDITSADAIAEGCRPYANSQTIDCDTPDPRNDFRDLWNSLNAKRGFGWDANPWVAALTFTVHKGNIDD